MKKIKLNDIVKVNQSGEWGTGLKEGEIGTKVIRTADFNNDGSINYDNVIFRNIQQKKIDEKKLIYGDIIIEKSGGTDKNPVGRVAFFNDDNNIYLSNNFTQVIRIKESMNSKFVFYNLYFNYKNGSTLQMFNKTTGIQNLQMKQFLNQKISYISLEEQEIAVRKLDNVRNIIEIKQKQLQDLDELIKSQFVGMFKNKNYEKKRIGDFGKFQGGYAFKSKDFIENGIKLVQISNVNKDNLDWNEINRLPEEYIEKYKDYVLNVGDVVMAMTRPIIKSLNEVKIAYVSENDVPCLLNQRVGRFLIDENKISKFYLTYCCKMEDFKNYVEKMSGNSLQPNISSKQVEDFTIEIPPIELQNQFADMVKQIDKQKFEIQKSLEEMKKLQESLMNKYFGEY